VDAQPSAARIPSSRGARRGKVSASVRRACIPDTSAAYRAPRTGGPGGTLIPGDGAAGDQGPRIGLPARQNGGYATPAGLSRLNDFLALWSQAHLPSCNRQVTSTSIHMAKPGPGYRSRSPRTAIKRALCLLARRRIPAEYLRFFALRASAPSLSTEPARSGCFAVWGPVQVSAAPAIPRSAPLARYARVRPLTRRGTPRGRVRPGAPQGSAPR